MFLKSRTECQKYGKAHSPQSDSSRKTRILCKAGESSLRQEAEWLGGYTNPIFWEKGKITIKIALMLENIEAN